jgi:hypothetical protein
MGVRMDGDSIGANAGRDGGWTESRLRADCEQTDAAARGDARFGLEMEDDEPFAA